MASAALKRRIGPGLLTAYGIGVMIGAGIYVLIGAVIAQAGVWAPLSFLIAGAIAAPSALSYAELSTRLPEAAGEAAYVEAGFAARPLAIAIGLAIVLAGTVSAAAVLRGGAGYLLALIDVPLWAVVLGLGALLVVVALIGVLESLALAALFTLIELGGLALVVWAGFQAVPAPDWGAPPPPAWGGVTLAAVLAFFAFIGFEDIVNMAEEVDRPERSLPVAILVSLVVTALIYALVALAAVRAVPGPALAASDRPLALVWQAGTGQGPAVLSAIAVAAALNGVLAQIVMAARVLYGLGARARWAAGFRVTHPRFGTPLRATVLVGAGVIGAALALPVAALAGLTANVLLGVFVIVNLALIRLKARAPAAPFRVPAAVPWVGALVAGGALAVSLITGGGG